jgi:hypothetical protein
LLKLRGKRCGKARPHTPPGQLRGALDQKQPIARVSAISQRAIEPFGTKARTEPSEQTRKG